MNGIIFDCKRFAVHDGAGLRSTLFLKGRPLRCPWCQNPEGLRREVQLWHRQSQCLQCGCCTYICPSQIPLMDLMRKAGTIVEGGDRA